MGIGQSMLSEKEKEQRREEKKLLVKKYFDKERAISWEIQRLIWIKNSTLNILPKEIKKEIVKRCSEPIFDSDGKILDLCVKYSRYVEDYDKINYFSENEHMKFVAPKCAPFLLDALTTSCKLPFVYSDREYTPEVEQDIKKIIEIFPDSLFCNSAEMRCRTYVYPLVIAIHNENIPLSIVDYLLSQGADPKQSYLVNAEKINCLNGYELRSCLSDKQKNVTDRYIELVKIYEKYGFSLE